MAELLVLGAGVYLAGIFSDHGNKRLDESAEQLVDDTIEAPRDLFIHQAREGGIIAPNHASVAGRVPFDRLNPPYLIARKNGASHTEAPTENLYANIANAYEHQRLDTEAEAAAARMPVARKRGGAIVTTFTRELSNMADPSMRTGIINWSWMPPNPTDSDYQDAGALVQAIPPNPELFTPDAFYFTAPNQPFRHGGL